MRFWLMSEKNGCVDDRDVRPLLREDLDITNHLRAYSFNMEASIKWRVNSPPFVLKELKIKERL